MEIMSNQYNVVKKNYGIDEALAESSESEPDEYISKFATAVKCFRVTNTDKSVNRKEQEDLSTER